MMMYDVVFEMRQPTDHSQRKKMRRGPQRDDEECEKKDSRLQTDRSFQLCAGPGTRRDLLTITRRASVSRSPT